MSLFKHRPIGDYMDRWVWQTRWFTVRLHHIQRPDADVELHDHPWSFFSLILKGWYEEERPRSSLLRDFAEDIEDAARGKDSMVCDTLRRKLAPVPFGDFCRLMDRETVIRRRGTIAYRSAATPHRITAVSPGGAWTFVVSTAPIRDWGFWTDKGWVYWKDFTSAKPGDVHHADGTVTRAP
ncbi:hypothetical protein UFOVP1382_122 [uncultured Caudovirales phage]|uniref:Uncharacterized protein n=1 Tax=uncultured Caudovirales phage TaxID=2100421 RepID=A0A6J5S549_9CAUD|nr:hypothetical protein UFOVP1382_122 [uncultured Caudovirales phage]